MEPLKSPPRALDLLTASARIAEAWARCTLSGRSRVGTLFALLFALFSLLPGSAAAESPTPDSPAHFDRVIAPLLSKHCLECHDSITREGRVDLSRPETAFGENRRGKFLVPGNAEESLVWKSVESDSMPEDRSPLTPEEKASLREWIEQGAAWPGGAIDPLAHMRDERAAGLWVQRLTRREYIATVLAATGVDISADALRLLPPDTRADGFTNTAYSQILDLSHIEAYARLAAIIAARLDLDAFLKEHNVPNQADDKSLRSAIATLGKWLLRGPLDELEQNSFLKVARASREEGDSPEATLRQVLAAMLQSPRFLYRMEKQQGEGESRALSGHELAARMSYVLWGGPPDRELARAADAGELADSSKAARQIERMLQDPRAVEQSTRFLEEWLNLDRLEHLSPDPGRFPSWDSELAADMREETRAFFRDVAWEQKRPLSDLFNAQFTHLTPRLAAHYRLEQAAAAEPADKRPANENASEPGEQQAAPGRVTLDLLSFYPFIEGQGDVVRDLSGSSEPADLKIADPSSVRWTSDGLEISRSTLLSTNGPPRHIVRSLQAAGEFSIEVWITTPDLTQSGPARLLTLSRDSGARNFTLGQSGDRLEVRLRTTRTSTNGLPEKRSDPGSLAAGRPVQIVFTRDASGLARIYVDGKIAGERLDEGDFSNWSDDFHLGLGNEISRDRPWRGTYHLAALYGRALSQDEIRLNHAAGPRADGSTSFNSRPLPAALAASSGADGLEALYRFQEGNGEIVHDVSGHSNPLDLRISDPGAVEWKDDGLRAKAKVSLSAGASNRLTEAVRASKAFTVEALVTLPSEAPKDLGRILTLSSGSSSRNFTLGHDRNGFEFRLRSDETNGNGMPGLKVGAPAGETTVHLVITRDAVGRARFFVDGKQVSTGSFTGDFKNWDSGFHFLLANETSGDRPWTGTFHRVSVWSRALSPEEVRHPPMEPTRIDLSDVPGRGGLLTHGSVLTVGGDEASMVARGLFILHDILSSGVTSAPPEADTTPVHAKEGLSRRDVAETRLADRSCSGCHAKFEPLAFGLEKFDGLGSFFDVDEHGNQLREDGEIHFPGDENPVTYTTMAELMDLLAGHDRVRWTITRKATQFALGRPLVSSDEPHLKRIHHEAIDSGGTYPDLISAIVLSDLIRHTPTETTGTTP